MKPTRLKLVLVLASTAVASTGALLYVAYRSEASVAAGEVRLVDNSEEIQALLVERRNRHALDARAPDLSAKGQSLRYPLSQEEATRSFAIEPGTADYDPFMGYRHKSGVTAKYPFPDHPDGYFIFKTNHAGYREDLDQLPKDRDLFVVVTGDSHTDGMCNNRESFANRLEASLASRHPGHVIEVLNTGNVGYSFYNYIGALEKHLPDKPDAFVVAFYGGNDFLDVVKLSHYYHHTAPPPRRSEYWEKMDKAKAVSSVALANALNQLLYFRYYPDQVAVAERAVLDVSAEIQTLCAERGIPLYFVYIPPGFDVDGTLKPALAKARDVLELSRFDLSEYNHIADRSIAAMRALGIEVIDLRDKFTDPIDTYYWSDLHINLKGHALIAELLLPKIEAACTIGK